MIAETTANKLRVTSAPASPTEAVSAPSRRQRWYPINERTYPYDDWASPFEGYEQALQNAHERRARGGWQYTQLERAALSENSRRYVQERFQKHFTYSMESRLLDIHAPGELDLKEFSEDPLTIEEMDQLLKEVSDRNPVVRIDMGKLCADLVSRYFRILLLTKGISSAHLIDKDKRSAGRVRQAIMVVGEYLDEETVDALCAVHPEYKRMLDAI